MRPPVPPFFSPRNTSPPLSHCKTNLSPPRNLFGPPRPENNSTEIRGLGLSGEMTTPPLGLGKAKRRGPRFPPQIPLFPPSGVFFSPPKPFCGRANPKEIKEAAGAQQAHYRLILTHQFNTPLIHHWGGPEARPFAWDRPIRPRKVRSATPRGPLRYAPPRARRKFPRIVVFGPGLRTELAIMIISPAMNGPTKSSTPPVVNENSFKCFLKKTVSLPTNYGNWATGMAREIFSPERKPPLPAVSSKLRPQLPPNIVGSPCPPRTKGTLLVAAAFLGPRPPNT